MVVHTVTKSRLLKQCDLYNSITVNKKAPLHLALPNLAPKQQLVWCQLFNNNIEIKTFKLITTIIPKKNIV